MNFFTYKSSFDTLMGVKEAPNQHELYLIKRAKKYIGKVTWVPGVRMIAIVNSLSMNATHKGSDIDLFIVTEKNRMWIARVWITLIFWFYGVWRKGADIAGNFCLSFWVEETAMEMDKIAIKDDVYLYFWMYYMKVVLADETIWQEFSVKNEGFQFSSDVRDHLIYLKKRQKPTFIISSIRDIINQWLRNFGEKKAFRNNGKKGNPQGVIISRDMLKFHDQDARKSIREKIFLTK